MPFTPTHTLAVVPLAWLLRKPAVFSSMVIGCMVPDWPLYVPFGPEYDLTHSLKGVFVACLPLGFAFSVFYQLALKRPLFELLPAYFQSRLVRYLEQPQRLSPHVLLLIAIAVLLGAASHVVWDAFTHRDMWGVAMFPSLGEVMFTIGSNRFRTYMVLQHGSTLVGFPIFLMLLAYCSKHSGAGVIPAATLSRGNTIFWRAALIAIPVVMSLKIILSLVSLSSYRGIFRVLYYGVTQAGLMFLVAFTALGLQYLWSSRRRAG